MRAFRASVPPHAALCAACHGVRSRAVSVALMGECSIPATRYWITWSARMRSVGGMMSPSVVAVL